MIGNLRVSRLDTHSGLRSAWGLPLARLPASPLSEPQIWDSPAQMSNHQERVVFARPGACTTCKDVCTLETNKQAEIPRKDYSLDSSQGRANSNCLSVGYILLHNFASVQSGLTNIHKIEETLVRLNVRPKRHVQQQFCWGLSYRGS